MKGSLIDNFNGKKQLEAIVIVLLRAMELGCNHWEITIYSYAIQRFVTEEDLSLFNEHSRATEKSLQWYIRNFIDVAYDCGVYSLCYAEAVCQEQFQSKTSSMSLKTITVELITQFRTKMKTLIADLAKEYHT